MDRIQFCFRHAKDKTRRVIFFTIESQDEIAFCLSFGHFRSGFAFCRCVLCNMLIKCRLYCFIFDIAGVSFIQSLSKQVFIIGASSSFALFAEARGSICEYSHELAIFLSSFSTNDELIVKRSHNAKALTPSMFLKLAHLLWKYP